MKITILAFDGTESIAATEWNLLTDAAFAADANTTEGEFQANIDINNFTGAEVMTFRVYEKIRTSASAQRLIYEFALSNGALGNLKGWQSPKFTLGNGWAMTMQLTSGTTKTVIWSIHRWQSGPTAAEAAAIQADTDDIQTRIPAALVSGRMDSSVGAMAAAVITAASIATDAFTAAKFAANAGTEIAAAVWDALTSTITTASSIGKLLVDNIDATISSRSTQTSVNTVDDFIDTEIADIQSRLPAALVSGRMDSSVGAIAAAAITAASIATDAFTAAKFAADAGTEIAAAVWDRLTSALTTVGSAGKLLVDNLNATITSRASQTSVDTVDDFLDTEIASIQADTDDIQTRLPAALVSGRMDSSVGAIAAAAITAASIATDAFTAAKFAADVGTEIAAAVWDRLTSALSTASSIGKLLVDNVNATISSRATQTSVDTIDDFVDTEVAAIKAKTDNLPSDPADASDIAALFAALPSAASITTAVWGAATRLLTAGTNIVLDKGTGLTGLNDLDAAGVRGAVGLASANLDTQLDALPTNAELSTALGTADDAVLAQVALVKSKTDLIPAAPAAVGDIPTVSDITTGVFGQVVETGLTFLQSLRGMSASLFGKVSGAGTATETFRGAVADADDRLAIESDVDGNRTNVVTNL